MNSNWQYSKFYFKLFLLFFLSTTFTWASPAKATRGAEEAITWGNVQINASPANNNSLDIFKLYQNNLYNLSCYIYQSESYSNQKYDIHGKDSNGDTILSSHQTRGYNYTMKYSYSRTNRDAVVTANTVLKRYIQVGICSASKSKFYKVGNCDDNTEVERCRTPRKESEYW